MSYDFEYNVAKKYLKDAGVYDIDVEAQKMAEGQTAAQMKEFGAPGTFQPATPAPAEPDPRSFTYGAPAGAEDPNTAIGKERQRFASAGVGQNEAYRLLGGPRQKLGA